MTPTLSILLLSLVCWTDAERVAFESIDDGPRFEEPGLYPLLAAAGATGDAEAGAVVPDYRALRDDPGAHRGRRFLLEGRFAGRARRVGLYQPGPWGDALTEWVIVTGEPDDVAVIYFVDPDAALNAPPPGRPVRTVGYFYKRWTDRDLHGQATDYLVFIAGDRDPLGAASAAPGAGAPPGAVAGGLLLVFVVVALPVLLALRRAAKRPLRVQDAKRHDDDLADQFETHLPTDPAEALDELARRHEAGQRDADEH